MADDDAAHCRRHDHLDLALVHHRQAARDGRAEPGRARRVHQHARALQVAGAVKPRGQDEVTFEQGFGIAELGQDLVLSHVERVLPGQP
jgi:hypothetical protein